MNVVSFKQISAFKYFSTKNMWPNQDEKVD